MIGVIRCDAAQTMPRSMKTAIRRRPSTSFAIGSWARTITTVLTKKTKPTPRSDTPAWFFM